MFGRRITLFKLLGFSVRIDVSWLIIAALIVWTLSEVVFKTDPPKFEATTRWTMGVLGALGLFASIVFHELCHSLAARRYGMTIKGITLFIFGGVAEMGEEPPSAKAEFVMAIAGPAASIAVSAVAYGMHLLGRAANWPAPALIVLGWLALINLVLAGFNLLPGFPLDGGRVLRSILWYWKDNLRWATRVASGVGGAFGMALIILGGLNILTGYLVAGMWWLLIGLFLRGAARQSYRQLLLRQALEGELVSRFMNPNPVSVPTDISVRQLVDDYIYRHHFKMFPVLDDAHLRGCVTVRHVKQVPAEDWPLRKVGDITEPCSDQNTIGPGEDAMHALSQMSRAHVSRLMVVEGDKLLGILSLKDLLRFFSLKVELNQSPRPPGWTAGEADWP